MRRGWLYPALMAGVVAVAAICLCFGSVSLPLGQLLAAAMGRETGTAQIILLDIRLPRMLAAALAGVGLSAAGVLLQSATGNDLCSPNVIGANAGAGLLVMLVLCLAPAAAAMLPAAAFCGSLATVLLVLGLSLGGGGRFRTTVVLAGVAVSAVLNAGIAFLSLRYPDVLSSYAAFSVGGFTYVQMGELGFPAVIVALCLVAAVCLAPRLNLLCLGDDMAASLGVRVKALRLAALILASALCAAIVSYAGLLGFVGLVVPHMARRLAGTDLRRCLPAAWLLGAILVMLADLGGRILFAPSELPAGILMAAIGAPFFLYLLLRRRYEHA